MPIRTCIDTGSTDCAIDADIVDSNPLLRQWIRRKTPKTCVAVDGKLIRSRFSLRLPIHIADKCYNQEFECISGLIHPVILGTNFLKSREAVLDFGKNTAQFGNDIVPFTVPRWITPAPPYLASMVDVVLQPESIQFVRADVIGADFRLESPIPENVLVGRFTGFETNLPVMAAWQIIKPGKDLHRNDKSDLTSSSLVMHNP